MDIVTVALPLSLAFIMFSLGIGLTFEDFKRVFQRPLAFGLGALNQVVVLPAVAFVVVYLFGLTGALAVGFMILSFCPGGVTTNILSRLAKGDVALSVSLTAVISLVSMITLPVLLVLTIRYFEGASSERINIAGVALKMAMISTFPILLGMMFRRFAQHTAERVETSVGYVANVLFVVIVIAALAANWRIFIDNFTTLAPGLIVLCAALLTLGYLTARMIGLGVHVAKTISIETGIQNATMGITVAALILGAETGFTAVSLPSAVYGILMYLVALPVVAWFRILN